MSPNRLAGRRILVTRAIEDAAGWAARLTVMGAEPLVLPCLVCQSLHDALTKRTLRNALATSGWLVLTSSRGAEAVARLTEVPPGIRIAAVGPATARVARSRFGRVDLTPREFTSRGLANDLIPRLRADGRGRAPRVVIAGAEGAGQDAATAMAAHGIELQRVAVYRTTPAPAVEPKRDLAVDGVEIILLASPSAVTGLVRIARLPPDARIISIGPTTTSAAITAGLTIAAQAARPTFKGMMEAIA